MWNTCGTVDTHMAYLDKISLFKGEKIQLDQNFGELAAIVKISSKVNINKLKLFYQKAVCKMVALPSFK